MEPEWVKLDLSEYFLVHHSLIPPSVILLFLYCIVELISILDYLFYILFLF